MGEGTRYRINAPKVIHETIDGEVIAVHVETGYYYELQGAGVDVWQGLDLGMDLPQIVGRLNALYQGDESEIERSTHRLIDELLSEQLIHALPAGETNGLSPSPAAAAGPARAPFAPPVLQKHTDLQGLLLLDPVHEVDEGGWPAPKEEKNPHP